MAEISKSDFSLRQVLELMQLAGVAGEHATYDVAVMDAPIFEHLKTQFPPSVAGSHPPGFTPIEVRSFPTREEAVIECDRLIQAGRRPLLVLSPR